MLRIAALMLLFNGLAGTLAAAELLPSEATTLMVRAMQQHPGAERTSITAPLIERMRTADLDDVERFMKGEAHFINFEPEAARDAFWTYRNRDDDLGRVAWQRLMIIRVNAFDMAEQVVAEDIPAYRERFGKSSRDRFGISYPLLQAAKQLAARGEPGRALEMVVDEVRRHDRFDAPYFAYLLPGRFMSLADEQGRGEEFRALAQWVSDGLRQAIAERLARSPAPERRTMTLPGSMLGTLFEDERLDYHDWTAEFLRLQARLGQPNAA